MNKIKSWFSKLDETEKLYTVAIISFALTAIVTTGILYFTGVFN